MAKNDPKGQPDFSDQDAVVEWLNDENITQEARQLRASQAQAYENRRADARPAVMNAVVDILPGPPSANQ